VALAATCATWFYFSSPPSGRSVTFEHIIYIPAALLVGIIFGYTMGARAVRRELAQLRRRVKR
jgi:hypothetical protein